MQDVRAPAPAGLVLPDASSGRLEDLGCEPAFGIVTLIRHRY